jgi:hypothetical protein
VRSVCSQAPLFFQLLEAGFHFIKILSDVLGGKIKRGQTVSIERTEHSWGIIIKHCELIGLGWRSVGDVCLELLAKRSYFGLQS